jgi:PKD repeat protein
MKRGIGFVVVLGAFALAAPPALAQKVANPTNSLGAVITSGSVVAGSGHQLDDSFSGAIPLFHLAQIAKDGTITVPVTSVDQVTFKLPDYSGSTSGCNWSVTNGSVTVVPTAPATGLLNPFTGAASLDVQFYLQGTYTLNYSCFGGATQSYSPSDCHLGSQDSPLEFHLTTGTTSPDPPNTPIKGTPYSDKTGLLKVVDNSFSLPASSGCDPVIMGFTLSGKFDQQAGLPSPDGNNTLIISGRLSPIIKRGVQAKLTATPKSGLAPLAVHLSAATSIAPAGVKSYAFSFGDGTHLTGSSATASHTYSKPGRYTATVTVTDNDGDHNASKLIIVVKKACVVPNVVGKPLAKAKTAITAAGCRVGKITKRQSTKPAGVVLAESPAAGRRIPAGSAVALTVAK